MAKQCKHCNITKPLDQFHKRSGTKDGLQYYCKSCKTQMFRSWYAKNKDIHQARYAQFIENNSEWASKYYHDYRINNLGTYAKNAAKRRAVKLNATPAWLTEDDDFIFNEIYEMRDIRSKDTGVTHHVDHIIPLQGEEACGLHVWWNLQLLPASENISKSNKVGGI